MSSAEQVGSVAALWRFPVKSMQGEQLAEVELGSGGIAGDRAYGLIDRETGKVASAKSVKLFSRLFECRAAFVEPPRAGAPPPPVSIELPGGATVRSDSADCDRALSSFLGREVTLADAAPSDYTIDNYLPDVEGNDPAGRRDVTLPTKLGAALFAELGAKSPVSPEAFFDAFPISLVTTSTLAGFSELKPESRFVERRFRMNLTVGTREGGFLENHWVRRELEVGDGVRLRVRVPASRCVMTTLPQSDLPRDIGVLRAMVEHNRLDIAGKRYPCAGVFAVVMMPGTVRVGDPVALAAVATPPTPPHPSGQTRSVSPSV
jgi:uncharacterized protein YcbX